MGDGDTDNFADFDTTEDNGLNWDSMGSDDTDSGFADFGEDTPNSEPDDLVSQEDYNEGNFNSSQQKAKFGYKTVGVLLLILTIILAGIFVFFDKISIRQKNPVQQTQVNQTSEGGNTTASTNGGSDTSNVTQQDTTQKEVEKIVPDESQSVSKPTESGGGMQALPPDVTIDYTGEKYETTGQVHNKLKYLDNSQVIYCIQVNAKIGEGNKLVSYYCGYNVFESVSEGDTVSLTYQIVSDTCYSVNTISK